MKKYLIILVLVYAFFLRFPIIFQPFNGYHAWNEGHYSMTALNFDKYGLLKQMNETGADYTATPFLSWLVYGSFKIFGVSEWAARLPNLIFGMFSIYLLFLITRKLYNDKIALWSSIFASAAHGIVYFSRNVQLESSFVFFLLSAIYFAILHHETRKLIPAVLCFLSMSISIFTKFPAVLGYLCIAVILFLPGENKEDIGSLYHRIIKFVIAVLLSLVPSLIWIRYAMSQTPANTAVYFTRSSEWSWHFLSKAILKTFSFTPEHLGAFISVLAVIGMVYVWKQNRKHLVLWTFILPWFFLLVPYPQAYLSNAYYDYPALYGLCILAAIGVVELYRRKKWVAVSLAVLSILFGIVKTYLRVTKFSHGADYTAKYDSFPFQSAKLVSQLRSGKETILVDFPQTMFYAGGDPEFVTCVYGNVESHIQEKKYDYIILNYFIDIDVDVAASELKKYNYKKVAPLAWKLIR